MRDGVAARRVVVRGIPSLIFNSRPDVVHGAVLVARVAHAVVVAVAEVCLRSGLQRRGGRGGSGDGAARVWGPQQG